MCSAATEKRSHSVQVNFHVTTGGIPTYPPSSQTELMTTAARSRDHESNSLNLRKTLSESSEHVHSSVSIHYRSLSFLSSHEMQSDVSIQQTATHRPITRTSRHLACHQQMLRSHHSVLHRKCLLVFPNLLGTGRKNQTTLTVVGSVKEINRCQFWTS